MLERSTVDKYFYKKCSVFAYDIMSYIISNYQPLKNNSDMKYAVSLLISFPEKHIRMLWEDKDEDDNYKSAIRNCIKNNNLEVIKLITRYFKISEPIKILRKYDPLHYADHHNSEEIRKLVEPFSNLEYYLKSKVLSQLIPLEYYFVIEDLFVGENKFQNNKDSEIYIRLNLCSHYSFLEHSYNKETKTLNLKYWSKPRPKSRYRRSIAEIRIIEIIIPQDTLKINFINLNKGKS
jgi:hypothetical protein